MDIKEEVFDRINIWASNSKKSYVRCCFDTTQTESTESLIVILLVGDSSKEAYLSMYDQLCDNLRVLSEDVLIYRVESHSHDLLRVSLNGLEFEVIVGCVPQSQVPKDENLSYFLDAPNTSLKPSRDSLLLRQLQKPRFWAWFEQWLAASDPSTAESFRFAYTFLVEWCMSRQIFGDGFLTREILIVMLVSVTPTNSVNSFELIKKFFRRFLSEMEMNESSVSSHVCGLTGTDEEGYYGSVINEDEGIDSDADEDLRTLRLARKHPVLDSEESGESHSNLAANANENDDVHPHKRLRFELGRIRDIRRFYAVENTRISKITTNKSEENKFKNFLDFLDVLTVCHPSPGFQLAEGEHVNLAIRVLESHKKLILQELTRANMIISDCVGDDPETVFAILKQDSGQNRNNEIQLFCVFEIESSKIEIMHVVASVVREQVWFLVEEMQATHGVLVVPVSEKSQSPEHVSVGLVFVTDDPYNATLGTEIDLLGPMSRVMLRAKKILKERPEYEEKLQGKFIVRSRVVRNV